jgi:CBS-domain-containing membrane protein
MKASELMTRDVVTARPDTPVRQAAARMAEHHVTSLPVLDDDGRVIGIVSEIDLVRDRLPRDPRSHLRRDPGQQPDPAQHVRDVMTEVVCCLGESADTADIAALMVDNNLRAVPIVDGARLMGIVSRRDVLRTLLRDDTAIVADVRERLDAYAGERDRWRIDVADGVASIRGHFDDSTQRDTVTALASTVPGVIRVHLHRH